MHFNYRALFPLASLQVQSNVHKIYAQLKRNQVIYHFSHYFNNEILRKKQNASQATKQETLHFA